MKKIGYTEVFYSLQGEGLYIGTPSIFLRLFGCNFRCKNYGCDKNTDFGKYNPDVKEIIDDIDKYKKFNDLPLVKTGCDSYGSVYPEFKRFAKFESVNEIVKQIKDLLPENNFNINKHLIITGGEPLLPGWQKVIPDLLAALYREANLEHVTFETNGTKLLSEDFRDALRSIDLEVTFSVSSKLPVSGHTFEEAIHPDVLNQYYWTGSNTYLKWVIASESDIEDVKEAIRLYAKGMQYMDDVPIYLMPVGGTTEGYFLNNKKVAEIAMKNGWRYSPRLQVELWKNKWGS